MWLKIEIRLQILFDNQQYSLYEEKKDDKVTLRLRRVGISILGIIHFQESFGLKSQVMIHNFYYLQLYTYCKYVLARRKRKGDFVFD